MREVSISAQDNKNLGVILDSLEPTSDLYSSLSKLVTRYYAVYDGSDYLHSGLNYTSPAEVKEDIISLNEPHLSGEYVEKLKKMPLAEVCSQFGYTLDTQYEPF